MSQPNLQNIRDVAIYVWELQTRDYAVNVAKIPKFYEIFGSDYFEAYFTIVHLTIAAIPVMSD